MNIFLMSASFPIDHLTIQEMEDLIKMANARDEQDVSFLMNTKDWKDDRNTGFVILAYSEQDQLLGFLVAYDLFGLNTYEWSIVVHPNVRRRGIGSALVQGLQNSLKERGALGDMALSFTDEVGHQFLHQTGYEYNSSEATLQAVPENNDLTKNIFVRTFKEEDKNQLIQLMQDGFGDMPYETEELISINTTVQGRTLYIIELDLQIVATVSLVENDMGIWVTAFTVKHSLRGQGIGSSVLQWVKNDAYARHQPKVLLDVEIDNKDALSVYKKAGFTPIHQVDYFTRT